MNARDPAMTGTDQIVTEVSRIVSEITGVQLGERQKSMVESRLKKRTLELGLSTTEEYLAHLKSNLITETSALVSLLTTHHTYFFREFVHFETLEKKILPVCIAAARKNGRKSIRIWSAACSRGQEVYSLAMFLAHHLPRMAPELTFEILGSDVDPESVKIAKNGVYKYDEIKEVPLAYLGEHWARGTGEISEYVKARDSIKKHCRFEIGNLTELSKSATKSEFDITFCRNVFIYFTPEQVRSISAELISRLSPEGYFVIGISESLNGMKLPVNYEGPSVYSMRSTTAMPSNVVPIRPTQAVPTAAPAPLRILCVDDSPSVLKILKKILSKESGFEVVATAANGLEASKMLKEHKVDALTLDIHMPEQTGLEYLMRNFGPSHPPVVMISSVSRESSELAMQCLKSGASDFIEKPALVNMAERGEEIRTKLQCAVQNHTSSSNRSLSLDLAFKTQPLIRKPETAFRSIVATFSSWSKLGNFFKETTGAQPPSVVFVEGSENVLLEYATALSTKIGAAVEVIRGEHTAFLPGKVYIADFAQAFEPIQGRAPARRNSMIVFGGLSSHGLRKLEKLKPGQLLFEDPGKLANASQRQLAGRATDVVPSTSFAYMSTEFLSRSHE